MKCRIVFAIVILSIFSNAFTQYDEKDILFRRANQLSNRRQFESANQIYLELIKTYPGDFQIIEKLVNNYIATSQLELAEKLLEEQKLYFPEIQYIQKKISILMAKGEMKEAEKLADNFIENNKNNINFYKTIATSFEAFRQFEISIKYYREARKLAKDETLFSREIAYNLQNLKKYETAISEYLIFLEKNPSYKNFVLNNLKLMYEEEKNVIILMEKLMSNNDEPLLLEIYALFLAHAQNYEKALEIYKKLDPQSLYNFANQQLLQLHLEIALEAFLMYSEKEKEISNLADVKIKIARLFMIKQDYENAKQYLGEVYEDEKLQSTRLKYKSKANKESRELLAEIAIIQKKPKAEVLNLFKEAKKFAMNLREQYEIEFRIIHYQLMTGELKQAENNLKIVMQQQEKGTSGYKMSFYYEYLLQLFQNGEYADSLLTELIINMPESEETRQALQLSYIKDQLAEEEWHTFFNFFKSKELQHFDDAFLLIQSSEIQNEYVKTIAMDWAKKNALDEMIKQLLLVKPLDEDLKAYSLLSEIQIDISDKEILYEKLIAFLQEEPNSFLSPHFRYLLNLRRKS